MARQISIGAKDAFGPKYEASLARLAEGGADLVLAFAPPEIVSDPRFAESLSMLFKGAKVSGCSSAGEIGGSGSLDGSISVCAAKLPGCAVSEAKTEVEGTEGSFEAGVRLGEALAGSNPKAVLLFAPGVAVNGSGLVDGLASRLPAGVPIFGALAGDGVAFGKTWVLGSDGASSTAATALSLSGEALRFAWGAAGGWVPFGPERSAEVSGGNELRSLDGKSALSVYKKYLGELASELPGAALRFPLVEAAADGGEPLIRTVLGVDKASGSITLAGNLESGGKLRLARATAEDLVDGAVQAAKMAKAMASAPEGEHLALLVSCVGRKLVMGARTDEEVEAVAEVLGPKAALVGLHSYGEAAPDPAGRCRLNNQTMSVALIGVGPQGEGEVR